MKQNRRRFIKHAAIAGAGLTVGGSIYSAKELSADTLARRPRILSAVHPIRILILGGTSFIGPHIISYALARGHEVTTFTRGQSVPSVHTDLLRHTESLIGDRADNLDALRGRTWDVVIDNSGRQEAWTEASARLLRDSANLYVYTSSTGVYYPYLNPPISEGRVLVDEVPPGLTGDERAEYGYGVMKTRSEMAARREFGDDRTLVVRPTYIIGPGDRSNRFPYWPVRLDRGGEVLVPGKPADPVQFIDVRDLAEFMVRMSESENAGIYNVVGPSSEMGIHACVHGIHAAVSSPVEWVSIPDYEFLKSHGVSYIVPWIMPEGSNVGSARVDASRAQAAGLTFRPLAKTSADVLEWWYSDAITDERRASLTDQDGGLFSREHAIIQAWRRR